MPVSAATLVEIFFLHDRGKAFAVWVNAALLGSCAAGTLSGYIVQYSTWPVQFWYNVGLELFVALLCLFFLEETVFARDGSQPPPLSFWSRLGGFVFLTRTVPRKSFRDFIGFAAIPFKAAFSPTAILVGLSMMMSITWAVGVNLTLALFLQTPVEQGGYGFTPGQNGAFTFTTWVAVFVAQIFTHFVNDRVPLALCKRRGGIWHPEYRLYPLVFPMLFACVTGLVLFGQTVHHHWDRAILGFAVFLIFFADIATVSSCNTYVVESIGLEAAAEVVTVLNFCRVILGAMVPLFMFDWIAAVGVSWVFGTMAFFNAAAYGLIVVLMVFGSKLRNLDQVGTKAEDDFKVMAPIHVAAA